MASKARVTSSDDRLEPVPDHVLSFLMSWMSPRELVLLGSSTCRLRKLSENSPDTWQRFLACKVDTSSEAKIIFFSSRSSRRFEWKHVDLGSGVLTTSLPKSLVARPDYWLTRFVQWGFVTLKDAEDFAQKDSSKVNQLTESPMSLGLACASRQITLIAPIAAEVARLASRNREGVEFLDVSHAHLRSLRSVLVRGLSEADLDSVVALHDKTSLFRGTSTCSSREGLVSALLAAPVQQRSASALEANPRACVLLKRQPTIFGDKRLALRVLRATGSELAMLTEVYGHRTAAAADYHGSSSSSSNDSPGGVFRKGGALFAQRTMRVGPLPPSIDLSRVEVLRLLKLPAAVQAAVVSREVMVADAARLSASEAHALVTTLQLRGLARNRGGSSLGLIGGGSCFKVAGAPFGRKTTARDRHGRMPNEARSEVVLKLNLNTPSPWQQAHTLEVAAASQRSVSVAPRQQRRAPANRRAQEAPPSSSRRW